ncbi:MAG: tetratricopeptide repeat protein [Elusimicrobiota bacterium]
MLRLLALILALLPALASATGDEFLTLPEYRKGLKELRGYFVKRGEDPTVADRYVANLVAAFPVALGERIPVTRSVFDSFLKYQAAWARKTRDSKNPNVTPDERRHEVERAKDLKAAFKAAAEAKSPRFYQAFQAAVKDVRTLRHKNGAGYTGTSDIFFSDQVDDAYTHIDAGDEALDKGDTATAIKEAEAALAINPGNADAHVLRAGAMYARRNIPAAVADAQSALILDPVNLQAQAILSLTADNPNAASAVPDASTGDDGRVSATPGVGRMLSDDLSVRAMDTAQSDPRGSLGQLGRAMALDPKNASASGWYATIANRAGDYAAALGSTARGLKNDPNDALAYYNKAYAMAGTGDRDGMLDALKQAARIDPVYRSESDRAEALNTQQALDTLFGLAAKAHQPAVPQPRHRSEFSLMMMTGFIASFLLVSGVTLYFRSSPRPTVS